MCRPYVGYVEQPFIIFCCIPPLLEPKLGYLTMMTDTLKCQEHSQFMEELL